MAKSKSFLIIQTAFTGDVILATALIEKLHQTFPDAAIDFLLRKGNESLLQEHPLLRTVLIWDKKKNKLRNLFQIIRRVRVARYDVLINVHRFASSGLITLFSRAVTTIGFTKNPLSFFFDHQLTHSIDKGLHEIERNQQLIAPFTGPLPALPKLYPTDSDFISVRVRADGSNNYICIAPTSVWFTKQFPKEKWIELIERPEFTATRIFLLGAQADIAICEFIRLSARHRDVINLSGQLSFLESAALMKNAVMNYVNDSAPMHLASSMNAPVTAVFCSTIPAFGFGPLSDKKFIIETKVPLACRPCGLHGYKACPLGHFKCALTIEDAH